MERWKKHKKRDRNYIGRYKKEIRRERESERKRERFKKVVWKSTLRVDSSRR